MKHFFLILLLTIINFNFSQKISFGKVSKDELSQRVYPQDTTASAVILYKSGRTTFRLSMDGHWIIDTKTDYKIKIYKKEGLSKAIQSFPYFVGGFSNETIKIDNAYTYNLIDNGSSIEKVKLKSESEFIEKINANWNVKKITFPKVKEGSIIEFTVEKSSPYISDIDPFYFQNEIPIAEVKYFLQFPDYFKINTILTGFEKINYENIKGSHVYSAKNIPALKEEDFVVNIDNYNSVLKLEIASIVYPGETPKKISQTWNDVAKNIFENENFGRELIKNDYFTNDINAVLSGLESQNDKINAIFAFVKDKVKWDGNFGMYTNIGVKNAYKNRTGNVAEINLILIAMLNHIGIKANPIILSTRSNGIPSFPSRTAFNYVIAGVEFNGNTILLDATDKNSLPNILPSRAINWVGRMIYQNGDSKEVNLQPNVVSVDNIILSYTISEVGKVMGNLKRQVTNYNAYNFRSIYGSMSKESAIESVEKKYDNIEIDNYLNENTQNLGLPIKESFDFTDNKHIEIIGDKIYFSPMLFFGLESNPFKNETRSYPIEFPFPYSDKYFVKIIIPDGYTIELLPKNENLIFGEKFLTHKFILTQEGNSINLSLQEDVNTMILSAEYYNDLKEYFQKIVNKQTEKIVLKKK